MSAGAGVVWLVDGEPAPGIEPTDSSVLRGDGCFEAIRIYDGWPFRLGDHLDRLERSAILMDLELPPRSLIEEWIDRVAEGRPESIVRVVLTRGAAVPGATGGGRCIVLAHPLPAELKDVRLMPVTAPWHPAGRSWELAGAKTISYAPNQGASRLAHRSGFDDALLVADDGTVLEGPTFSVGWCRDGVVYTPSLDLGILASVTRKVVMELTEVREVRAPLPVVLAADEVFAMSTMKEVTPVVALGDVEFAPGPVTDDLSQRVGLLTKPG